MGKRKDHSQWSRHPVPDNVTDALVCSKLLGAWETLDKKGAAVRSLLLHLSCTVSLSTRPAQGRLRPGSKGLNKEATPASELGCSNQRVLGEEDVIKSSWGSKQPHILCYMVFSFLKTKLGVREEKDPH